MKKILVILVGLLVILSIPAYGWIGEERLWEIDQGILDTERKLLNLDKSQLQNRLIWIDWGIDLLTQDAKEMDKEIAQDRERWDELRRGSYDSERAWATWERAGRKLDELEWRKQRLHRVLSRLKRLRYRLGVRLREVRRISRPGPFRLGLGVGYLNSTGSTATVCEIGLRINGRIVIFYGSDYEEERDRTYSYCGGEVLLGKISFTTSTTLRFPVGIRFVWNEDELSGGIIGGIIIESQWENARGEITKGFGQVRIGLSGEEFSLTLLMGVLF